MTVPNSTYRVLVEKLGAQNASTFIGNEGEVFYDPNNPALRLSDGSTPGGVAIGGTGGSGDTGNITFSEEKIIGAATTDFTLGVIQLTPSLDIDGAPFVTNGQYVNIYPTVADDSPHIHITAGTLSTTSFYYSSPNNYLKGDLFIGDDNNFLAVFGNGQIQLSSDTFSGQINFRTGTYGRNVLNLASEGNDINIYDEGVEFDSDYALGRGQTGGVGAGSSSVIYTSGVYADETGSVKLLVQCQGSNDTCQLSELLIVRPYQGSTVFMSETNRVTGIGTSAHITFSAEWDGATSRIKVYADTSSDPNNDQWSFRIMPIEIQEYQD